MDLEISLTEAIAYALRRRGKDLRWLADKTQTGYKKLKGLMQGDTGIPLGIVMKCLQVLNLEWGFKGDDNIITMTRLAVAILALTPLLTTKAFVYRCPLCWSAITKIDLTFATMSDIKHRADCPYLLAREIIP